MMRSVFSRLALTALATAILSSLTRPAHAQGRVNPACFKKETQFAGVRVGSEKSDEQLLIDMMNTETRMWGFQICTSTNTGVLTAFRVETARDFGNGDYIDMTALGPGTANCRRYKLSDPDAGVSRIVLHVSEVVLGITLTAGTRTGSWG